MKKIIGIFIMMLLIGTAVLPLVSSSYKNDIYLGDDSQINNNIYIINDCKCDSYNYYYNKFSIMSDPLEFYNFLFLV